MTRILLVTRNLPPLVGGMERLNWHMADELSRRAEVRVIGPIGSAHTAPEKVSVREIFLCPLWKFLVQAQWRALREARRWKPDIVLAGSGLTTPAALVAAHASGARAVAYVHGLDLTVRHPLYRSLWLPALRRMDRVIANSRATAGLAEGVGVPPARIGVVHPGVTMPASSPDEASIRRFRARNNLGDGPLLLSVGRLSARKGLREFVAEALPRIAAVWPDVVFVVVGDTPNNALHAAAQTPESIRIVAGQAGLADNLRFLGTITNYAELGVVYRAADVHVFPVRTVVDDPEGFGMVAIEAAAHGLQTVAFATGGVVDAVADQRSGRLVEPADYVAFADAVLRVLSASDAPRGECIAFAQQFAWPEFGGRLAEQLCGVSPAVASVNTPL